MIRLAIAVGFLSVFGLVAVVLVILLKDFFKPKQNNITKNENEQAS